MGIRARCGLVAWAAAGLLGPAGAQAQSILNIHAGLHCANSGQTADIVLSPGVYDFIPVGQAQGGLFTAFNPFDARVQGCGPEGWACTEGWLCDYGYWFDGDPMGAVYGVNCNGFPFFQSPGQALAAANPVRISVSTTTTYHFRVGSGNDCNHNVGGVSLLVSVCVGVATQPADAVVCGDGGVSFTAAGAGEGPFTHRWQCDLGAGWEDIPEGATVSDGEGAVAGTTGSTTPVLTCHAVQARPTRPRFRCIIANACGQAVTQPVSLAVSSQDYNGDGDFGTDQDIEAFFACLAGSCCAQCHSGQDFNGDGDFGTDQDIEAFFRVLAGGAC